MLEQREAREEAHGERLDVESGIRCGGGREVAVEKKHK
jgi:hypothetical protein